MFFQHSKSLCFNAPERGWGEEPLAVGKLSFYQNRKWWHHGCPARTWLPITAEPRKGRAALELFISHLPHPQFLFLLPRLFSEGGRKGCGLGGLGICQRGEGSPVKEVYWGGGSIFMKLYFYWGKALSQLYVLLLKWTQTLASNKNKSVRLNLQAKLYSSTENICQ